MQQVRSKTIVSCLVKMTTIMHSFFIHSFHSYKHSNVQDLVINHFYAREGVAMLFFLDYAKIYYTFFGEKMPSVLPSSFRATPISANTASRCRRMLSVRFNFSSQVSFSSRGRRSKVDEGKACKVT